MKTQKICTGLIAVLALGCIGLAPVAAVAQRNSDRNQQQQKPNRDWVKAGNGDMGAAYSNDRMNRDRHSQDEGDQARARIYAKKSFMHNGQRYVRHSHRSNGKLSFTFKVG
jgi:hypothetical protein